MSVQGFASPAARIGKYKGGILAHAVPQEYLARQGEQVKFPKNSSDTIIFRRWLPYGATSTDRNTQNRFYQDGNGDRTAGVIQAHQTQEGVTNTPDSITPLDITAVMQEYSCLYAWTDKVEDVYEDDIPEQMKKQIGERIAYVNEQIIYGQLKAGTNQFYGGSGTSTATVNGKLTLPMLRKITKNLKANHAKTVTSMLSASAKFGTDTVRMGYVVFCHTDLQPDIEDLPGFAGIEKYASGSPMPGEFGKTAEFRFILHPDLPSIQNGGAAIGSDGLVSTSGTSNDVYLGIVLGEEAFGQVAFRGMSAMDPTYLPAKDKSKSDPHGQRGYAGSKWWKAVVRQNEGWMAVFQVGVTNI